MQSFRTELENPIVEQDIIDLERKIRAFREGKIHDEKFRSLRLARGVYGQRQPGVQMVRIKLPFGKVTFKQLLKIADISDEYGSGNLHLTTRQDIQIHYVSLDRTPQLWAELEQDDITLREACGNTVRNVTSSPALRVLTRWNRLMFRLMHRQHLSIFCVTLSARKWAANSRSLFHQAMQIRLSPISMILARYQK
jgi:sulfite reductase beta subunit-like hemoprotein